MATRKLPKELPHGLRWDSLPGDHFKRISSSANPHTWDLLQVSHSRRHPYVYYLRTYPDFQTVHQYASEETLIDGMMQHLARIRLTTGMKP